ncbi:FKBP-type peptidyl-prolyl cis-trans isomerase [Enterobacteriaceae endosymbiont of Plateumaris pusilla]|uniref:FKBP-type peptidyl-prolyl cis-trans isomerase n=1 Tax=Enterobacteriaceae endosymbiont of Plateumaris pusilla TaxID=2675795 RepID=UPI001449C518|nr:FKBP-type peptidyl-prolyl cis-trans isomerase [Enterobacteriaceae endosymbiont of Plateumaris pusilla]QJC29626.1 FKBP-type peptidyl-prolyl cis-trans isomerase [Enterobacteriaceae endosymbiont of Plateumaris pusilla]
MKFFTKKISIFLIIFILAISLNLPVEASVYKNIKLKNNNKKETINKSINPFNIKKKGYFHNKKEQHSYAMGIIIGKYLQHSFQEQRKVNILLNKKFVIQGIIDCINNSVRITERELILILKDFELEVKNSANNKMKEEARKNSIIGKKYIAKFLKEKNTKKSKTGLVYQIQKIGYGKRKLKSNSNDIVVVHYKGTLVDGTMFDSSYSRKNPLSIHFQEMIAGWKEALQYITKGGKIKIIVPPSLGYGHNLIPGIPVNSTLIFEIELLDIKDSFIKNKSK